MQNKSIHDANSIIYCWPNKCVLFLGYRRQLITISNHLCLKDTIFASTSVDFDFKVSHVNDYFIN